MINPGQFIDCTVFMGAIIRITGLFVLTMGIQMTINGVHDAMPYFLRGLPAVTIFVKSQPRIFAA